MLPGGRKAPNFDSLAIYRLPKAGRFGARMGYTACVLHSLCSELHVREVIRREGYRLRQYTHELVAIV